jgi:hypothetical protein
MRPGSRVGVDHGVLVGYFMLSALEATRGPEVPTVISVHKEFLT